MRLIEQRAPRFYLACLGIEVDPVFPARAGQTMVGDFPYGVQQSDPAADRPPNHWSDKTCKTNAGDLMAPKTSFTYKFLKDATLAASICAGKSDVFTILAVNSIKQAINIASMLCSLVFRFVD